MQEKMNKMKSKIKKYKLQIEQLQNHGNDPFVKKEEI